MGRDFPPQSNYSIALLKIIYNLYTELNISGLGYDKYTCHNLPNEGISPLIQFIVTKNTPTPIYGGLRFRKWPFFCSVCGGAGQDPIMIFLSDCTKVLAQRQLKIVYITIDNRLY